MKQVQKIRNCQSDKDAWWFITSSCAMLGSQVVNLIKHFLDFLQTRFLDKLDQKAIKTANDCSNEG